MMNDIALFVGIGAALLGAGFFIWSRISTGKTLDRVEELIDRAMTGDTFQESFSEDRTSRLETKLTEYLRASGVSALNVKNERDKIKTLIADISHQTKTPIANLVLHGELLKESDLDPEQGECVDAILRESDKLRFLIDALVKLSRLENGILSLDPEKESVSSIVTEVAAEMRGKADKKGLYIKTELPGEDISASFDRKWTSEALINIVDNAVKYTQSGGITLSVKEFEMFVCISVRDTGIGIAEEDIPRIFGRFNRLESSRNEEGVGIGLYLAREIVKLEGGYMKVSSKPGEGSEFDVFLKKE